METSMNVGWTNSVSHIDMNKSFHFEFQYTDLKKNACIIKMEQVLVKQFFQTLLSRNVQLHSAWLLCDHRLEWIELTGGKNNFKSEINIHIAHAEFFNVRCSAVEKALFWYTR